MGNLVLFWLKAADLLCKCSANMKRFKHRLRLLLEPTDYS